MLVFRDTKQLRPHIIVPDLVRTEHRHSQKISNAFSDNLILIFFFLVAKVKPRCAVVPSLTARLLKLSTFLPLPLHTSQKFPFPLLFSFLSFLWHNLVIYRHFFPRKSRFLNVYHCSYLKRLPLKNVVLWILWCCSLFSVLSVPIIPCSVQYDFFHQLQGSDINLTTQGKVIGSVPVPLEQ